MFQYVPHGDHIEGVWWKSSGKKMTIVNVNSKMLLYVSSAKFGYLHPLNLEVLLTGQIKESTHGTPYVEKPSPQSVGLYDPELMPIFVNTRTVGCLVVATEVLAPPLVILTIVELGQLLGRRLRENKHEPARGATIDSMAVFDEAQEHFAFRSAQCTFGLPISILSSRVIHAFLFGLRKPGRTVART
jgi:hypothetical protein